MGKIKRNNKIGENIKVIKKYRYTDYNKESKKEIDLNCKENYEIVISNLSKEILNREELIRIKEKRREEIKDKLDKKSLKEEYEFIKDSEKIEKLVEENFSKEFLMDLPKNGNVVLVMGINPGGGEKIIKRKEKTKDSILFLNEENLNNDTKKDLDIFNGKYVFTHGYHKTNYNLFSKINAKAHWAMDNYLCNKEVEKMLINTGEKSV